ncbi:MAG: DUF4126 domain-containing protein [Phycisphaeraceae bacterium]
MEAMLGILVGVSLAAATGFRVFVPMLVASVAVRADYVNVIESFEWLGSDAAVVAFAAATAAEVAAYFVPWLDNALDSLASPAAIVAGTLLSGSMMVDLDPWLRWSLALVAGGGAAGIIQGSSVVTRAASSVTTAGFGNPAVSFGEAGGATALSILAVAAPLVAVLIVVALIGMIVGFFTRARRRRTANGQRQRSRE